MRVPAPSDSPHHTLNGLEIMSAGGTQGHQRKGVSLKIKTFVE